MPDMQPTILAWLHRQQDWLQQAAEMLLASGSVSEADIDTLVARLKTQAGQQVASTRTFAEFGSATAANDELRLVSIGDVHGIENLGPPSPLAFGAGNLCVIYGHNASGKSGYVRLLKRACGKPHAAALRPNVYQPVPVARGCKIGYVIGGNAQQVEWAADGQPLSALQAVDIFDSEAALSYLTEETAASYTPPAVALFGALAAVCNRVKAKLQAEQSALARQLPALPAPFATSTAGAAYQRLQANVDDTAVEQLVAWKPEDDEALARLTARLQAADPAAAARAKRNTQTQVTALIASLKAAGDAFGTSQLAVIRALRTDAVGKRRIANESAKVASAQLDGVGSETWRALWDAARAYSQVAYPGKTYPVTDAARCVLCQQELQLDAQKRLHDFDDFVRRKVEMDAVAAEMLYQETLDGLPVGLTADELSTRCQAAGLTDATWLTRLGGFWDQVRKTRGAMLGGESDQPAAAVAQPTSMLTALTDYATKLGADAKQLDEDAKAFDRVKASKDKLNLEARKWIAQQADALRAEVVRLRTSAKYEKWKSAANSREISVQAGEIAAQVVTQAFVDRFNAELKALGAHRIKVELQRTRVDHGYPLHELRLKGMQAGGVAPDAILSDGERRIVGLAAFLADVVGKPGTAPFVFDDPISSLDQEYEWNVVTRLVELAKTRQVIVFTHRLSLYGMIEDAAKHAGESWKAQHLVQMCVQSFNGTAGYLVNQPFWCAKTKAANNILLTRLAEAKQVGEQSGPGAYQALAQGICSDFRKLLERTIENDLLNEVVQRHRRSVQTLGRLEHLSCITADDCRFFDDLMTKYSVHEHSQSPEVSAAIPDEPELRQDIEALKKWRSDFASRPAGSVGHA